MKPDNINKSLDKNIRYKPALTKVAEWINAEAGIGASIESGNQTWKPNWADLQKQQIVKKKM